MFDITTGVSQFLDQGLLIEQADRLTTAIWIFDFDQKRILWANQAALDIWEAETLEDLRSRDLGKDMSGAVETRLQHFRKSFMKKDKTFSEYWTITPMGSPKSLEVTFRGVWLKDGRMAMLCEGHVDHASRPDVLRSAEALQHTTVMITLYAEDGTPLYRNPASRRSQIDPESSLFERVVDHKDIKGLMQCMGTKGQCRLVARVRTIEGIRWHEITARACNDAFSGNPAFLVSELDITELKLSEERVSYLADHDLLTGLPNRRHLQSTLPDLIDEVVSNSAKLYIYCVDLDGFKSINDTMGHANGDRVLKAVSAKLSSYVAERGILARLGSDEFLICVPDRTDAIDPTEFGAQLLDLFSSPIEAAGRMVQVSLSVGLSVCPDDGIDMDTLMYHSDLAHFEAKSQGRSKWAQFSIGMRQKMEEKVGLEKDLKRAIREHELELFFQPRTSLKTGEILSAEALLRWRHPERGLLAPALFIPACEESGLIVDVGEWAYRRVAVCQKALAEEGIGISLSVNLSPRQFSDVDLVDKILKLPETTGCDPEKIGFEVTESVLVGDSEQVHDALTRLKDCGYGILIDDFGTGYSNLAYIQKYPVDVLKIDRAFIKNIETTGPIARLIISMANLMAVRIVAEGVETRDQLDWLARNGCHEYQGFYFSQPVPFDTLVRMYRDQTGEGPGKNVLPLTRKASVA